MCHHPPPVSHPRDREHIYHVNYGLDDDDDRPFVNKQLISFSPRSSVTEVHAGYGWMPCRRSFYPPPQRMLQSKAPVHAHQDNPVKDCWCRSVVVACCLLHLVIDTKTNTRYCVMFALYSIGSCGRKSEIMQLQEMELDTKS